MTGKREDRTSSTALWDAARSDLGSGSDPDLAWGMSRRSLTTRAIEIHGLRGPSRYGSTVPSSTDGRAYDYLPERATRIPGSVHRKHRFVGGTRIRSVVKALRPSPPWGRICPGMVVCVPVPSVQGVPI